MGRQTGEQCVSNRSRWIGVGHRSDGDPLIEEAVDLSTTQHNGVNIAGEGGKVSEHLAHVVIEQLKVTQNE